MSQKLEVGDTLYYVDDDRPDRTGVVRVMSVGKKWAGVTYLTVYHASRNPCIDYRIDVNTLEGDPSGNWGRGRCYSSRREYERMSESPEVRCLSRFRYAISKQRVPREGVTIGDIHSAAKLLGIKLEEA